MNAPPTPASSEHSARSSDDSGPQSDDPSPRSPTPEVDIIAGRHPSLAPGDLDWLRDHAARAMQHIGATGELRVRIVGDAEIAAAHDAHLDNAATTDVITFDLAGPGEPIDADALINLDEAVRQASLRGHPVRHELLLYALHALLHCAGENDTTDGDAERMHRREDEVLAAIGLAPVFAREPERER